MQYKQSGKATEKDTEYGLVVYDHFHLWIKRKLQEREDIEAQAEELVKRNPDCIILCDEIGNGIVPIQKEEREYRERTGRILCALAAQAKCVERVICGIGQKIR